MAMKEGKKFIVVYVDETLRQDLKAACGEKGVSMSDTIRSLIIPWIEANKPASQPAAVQPAAEPATVETPEPAVTTSTG